MPDPIFRCSGLISPSRGTKIVLYDRPPHHFHRSSPQETHEVRYFQGPFTRTCSMCILTAFPSTSCLLGTTSWFPSIIISTLLDIFHWDRLAILKNASNGSCNGAIVSKRFVCDSFTDWTVISWYSARAIWWWTNIPWNPPSCSTTRQTCITRIKYLLDTRRGFFYPSRGPEHLWTPCYNTELFASQDSGNSNRQRPALWYIYAEDQRVAGLLEVGSMRKLMVGSGGLSGLVGFGGFRRVSAFEFIGSGSANESCWHVWMWPTSLCVEVWLVRKLPFYFPSATVNGELVCQSWWKTKWMDLSFLMLPNLQSRLRYDCIHFLQANCLTKYQELLVSFPDSSKLKILASSLQPPARSQLYSAKAAVTDTGDQLVWTSWEDNWNRVMRRLILSDVNL